MSTAINPLAGKIAPASVLIDVAKLLAAYSELRPDPAVPAQRVAFGTSGHRGSSLERHRVTFPRPLLAEERDAMQVQSLVAAGRYDEARMHADAFHEHNHDSLFLHVVDTAIASIP